MDGPLRGAVRLGRDRMGLLPVLLAITGGIDGRGHVLVAEGARRGGRSRCANSVTESCGALGDVHTRPTPPEDLPHGEFRCGITDF